MANYHIRKYQNSDYEIVRNIYSDGVKELSPTMFLHVLKLPRTIVFLMGVFLTLLMSLQSLLWAPLAVVVLLVLARVIVDAIWTQYVQCCFQEDLLDIQKSYLQSEHSCFWVAEVKGEVVGIVGAQPIRNAEQDDRLELKRMVVKKGHRGKGIAKALCGTMMNFAQRQGYKAIVLETTQLQHAGQKLYERLGFKRMHEIPFSSPVGEITCVNTIFYRYDMPTIDKGKEKVPTAKNVSGIGFVF
ncbi:probable N-acetyltransferase CML1 [Rhinatrema bivittatum]|uniref:probable N-acetyltransferase CML1 n=1 Tax=Rhinatrema bivittatum TaxID=194408 RepID=UPI00112A15CF|nr:probable N-acetyltransferase CML1 [Rhinatrema bivittatum]XP_029451902.1 probable N-acetyltransferase CML1 [Rhinatrema bivittatum]XP_029451910.1 probable N-acetyltransferase CML1 [Rhinatrema bivittatum]